MRIDVLRDGVILETATTPPGGDRTARVRLTESGCFTDDADELHARVAWVGDDRSAEAYVLAVDGSF
jgi:hypothetical protein